MKVARDSSEHVWAKRLVASSFAFSCWCDRCARCPCCMLMRQVRVASLIAMGCVDYAGGRPGLVPVALDA